MADTNANTPEETYSAWRANDYVIEPIKVAKPFSKFFAGFFLTWAILSFLYAEANWLTSSQADRGVGVGTSAYALVLYGRPIALACISVGFYLASIGDLIVRRLRVSRRDVIAVPIDPQSPSVDVSDDSDLFGRRIAAEIRRRYENRQ